MARSFDPSRLDVEAFADDDATLGGDRPLAAFERLASSAAPDRPATDTDRVRFRLRGERRRVRGGTAQAWLHVEAQTRLALECQRCLQPVETDVVTERSFVFAPDEASAERLDNDIEEDVVVTSHAFDALGLVEDELLLALPLVPRHDVCPEPLPVAREDDVPESPEAHPFAALAQLRPKKPLN